MISHLNSEFNDFGYDDNNSSQQDQDVLKESKYERYRSKAIRKIHTKISDIIPRSLSPIHAFKEKHHAAPSIDLSDATDPDHEVLNDGILN